MKKLTYLALHIALTYMSLVACTTLTPSDRGSDYAFGEDPLYRRDVALTVDGRSAIGTITVPDAPTHTVVISLRDEADSVQLSTCHRDDTMIDPDKKKITYVFTPERGIEDADTCPLQITCLNKKGENAWGIVDFVHANETLPLTVRCSGKDWQAMGASLCQAKAGSVQMFVVPDPEAKVRGLQLQGCVAEARDDGVTYEYVMPSSWCAFKIEFNGRTHRHMTFGYDQVWMGGRGKDDDD